MGGWYSSRCGLRRCLLEVGEWLPAAHHLLTPVGLLAAVAASFCFACDEQTDAEGLKEEEEEEWWVFKRRGVYTFPRMSVRMYRCYRKMTPSVRTAPREPQPRNRKAFLFRQGIGLYPPRLREKWPISPPSYVWKRFFCLGDKPPEFKKLLKNREPRIN